MAKPINRAQREYLLHCCTALKLKAKPYLRTEILATISMLARTSGGVSFVEDLDLSSEDFAEVMRLYKAGQRS